MKASPLITDVFDMSAGSFLKRLAREAEALSCFNCSVVDLGAGSGLLAILAARAMAGSGTIWAIEATHGSVQGVGFREIPAQNAESNGQ